MVNFTFGADPEFIILDKSGKPVSAADFLPKKIKPVKIDGYSYYYDNLLAECTLPPSKTKKETIEIIRECLKNFVALIRPHKIVPIAVMEYSANQLKSPAALEIGCNKELCVYEMKDIEPPINKILNSSYRSAGGHIHIGSDIARDMYEGSSVARMMDLFLGIPSIYLDHNAQKRKNFYGQAGRIRTPKYGIEYRTLSNFWFSCPKMVELVYDITEFVINFVSDKKHEQWWKIDKKGLENEDNWNKDDFRVSDYHVCYGYNVGDLRYAIDNADKAKAQYFIKLISDYLPDHIIRQIKDFENRNFEMYEEWGLKTHKS